MEFMRKSRVAVFSVLFILGISVLFAPFVSAEKVSGYDIKSGENGGSYLVAGGKVIISGGEVLVSGKSNMPLHVTGDARIVLDNVDINSLDDAAISIDSGVEAEVILVGENKVTSGGKNAGIAVGYIDNNNMATLTISGDGELIVTGGADGGAGIGGNGTKDAKAINGKIVIEGGTIIAEARANSAGIGGGTGEEKLLEKDYTAGEIVINEGSVSATGNGGSAGIGGGNYVGAKIEIKGGTLKEVRGGDFAAGIGGGSCSRDVSVEIDGGVFDGIYGYESSAEEALGGAVIGSGAKVCETDAKTMVAVNDGVIKNAVAGWGASGIGGGAGNDELSDVTVGKDAQITRLYTDGEKMPLEEGSSVEGSVLQVVLSETVDTNEETNFEVVKFGDKSEAYKMELPKGYRAFVTTVKSEADYSVRGESYYAEKSEDEESKDVVRLSVAKGTLVAHSNLHPVAKEITKAIDDEDGNDADSNVFYWVGGGMAIAATLCLFVVYGKIM